MIRDDLHYGTAKWRVKISHITEQGFDIEGIIHVGANNGEELPWYREMGIYHLVAFEPLDGIFEKLESDYPSVHCFKLALGNEDNDQKILNIASGDAKGSSVFFPDLTHPEVTERWKHGQDRMVGTQVMKMRKFSTWAKEHPEIDLSNYDTIVMDTQGNEMEVLLGMEEYLQHFKFLSLELSYKPVYFGETSGEEVSDWLDEHGFIRDSPIFSHNDVFFIRKDIKSVSDRLYRGLA